MKNIRAIFILLLLFFGNVQAETIIARRVTGEKEQLAYKVLQLALDKSGASLELTQATEDYNEARLMSEVEAGNVDVIWTGSAPEKDKRLLAVRIPIMKGLLGHRIFIIRKQDEYKFSQIKTFDELKRFSAGQGTFWGDTKVLKNAGIPTITTIKYANLFPMLEGGRFDYFPRAVHEPWAEVEAHADLNLVVDKNIMLIYPFANYFYVNKSNQRLHDIIYRGFEAAIKDGSFDQLFFNDPSIQDVLNGGIIKEQLIKAAVFDDPSIQDVLKKADLPNRRVFRAANPFMHPDTPTDRKEFWLDVNTL